MIQRFITEESGLEMVEWAVVAVGVVIAAIVVFGLVGDNVKTAMTKIKTATD